MSQRIVARLFFAVVIMGLTLVISQNAVRGQGEPGAPQTPYQRWAEAVWENLDHYQMTPDMLRRPEENGASGAPPQSPSFYIPDHYSVVLQSFHDGNWDIKYHHSGDTHPTRTLASSSRNEIHPRLSYGAERVVFSSNRKNDYELYMVNPDDSNISQLTDDTSDDVNAAWSPDGQRIAFESYRDGQPEVYVMNVNGSGLRRLTAQDSYDGTPSWSPDGQKIAFASSRDGYYQIYTVNADGTELRRLATGMHSLYPAWSPDGELIAFSADSDGNGWLELWTMKKDGTDLWKLRDPGAQKDIWVRGWIEGEPGDPWIIGTLIEFILYNGNWYWTQSETQRWDRTGIDGNLAYDMFGTSWNPDGVSVDTTPPTMVSFESPPFARRYLSQSFSRPVDTGGAGIAHVEVQRREYPGGAWVRIDNAIYEDAFVNQPPAGKSYVYRLRAWDRASNASEWVQTTPIIFYEWMLTSTITDNRGNVLPGVTVLTNPESFLSIHRNGSYVNYADGSAPEGSAQWTMPGYQDVQRTLYNLEYVDYQESIRMRPANDVVSNGDFEAGTLDGWQTNDSESVDVTFDYSTYRNRYYVTLLPDGPPALTISQTMTIPADIPNPTLSFRYRMRLWSPNRVPFEVTITDGAQTEVLFSENAGSEGWQHVWKELSAWQGKRVTLFFTRRLIAGNTPELLLDDISLGSTWADLWLSNSGGLAALPGETVTRTLQFGNRGGVPAPGTTMTLTLPATMTLMNAVPAADGNNPYTWNLGEVAAGDSGSISLALRMDEGAPTGQVVTAQATVATGYEAYLLNNERDLAFVVGKKMLLPVIVR